jgi:transposase-like protein
MRTGFPDPAETWTVAEARVVLDQWRRSGASMTVFARKHGVTAPRLYWWKKRLASRAAPTPSLVPATIVTHAATITIRLPGDVTVEVANASPSWVASIIAELTRSS